MRVPQRPPYSRSRVSVLFSEPKIPQSPSAVVSTLDRVSFSALQRAENSSIPTTKSATEKMIELFQCSSASRKFLNCGTHAQLGQSAAVSVLFSEPKIPQFAGDSLTKAGLSLFQCSSASRKFLNAVEPSARLALCSKFQCSSASRKFLNPDPRTCVHPYFRPR